jgi:hypothetical protein
VLLLLLLLLLLAVVVVVVVVVGNYCLLKPKFKLLGTRESTWSTLSNSVQEKPLWGENS